MGLALLLALGGCSPLGEAGQGIALPTQVVPSPAPVSQSPSAPVAAAPGTQPAPTLPAGWRMYTDPEAGYSIALPPGVDIRAGHNAAGVYTARVQFQLPDVPGYQGLVIRVERNPGGRGLEQILPQAYGLLGQESPVDLLARAQQVVVAGLSAVRLAGSGEDFALIVPYGDRVYYVAPVHDAAFTGPDPRALEVFNRMLGTFTINK